MLQAKVFALPVATHSHWYCRWSLCQSLWHCYMCTCKADASQKSATKSRAHQHFQSLAMRITCGIKLTTVKRKRTTKLFEDEKCDAIKLNLCLISIFCSWRNFGIGFGIEQSVHKFGTYLDWTTVNRIFDSSKGRWNHFGQLRVHRQIRWVSLLQTMVGKWVSKNNLLLFNSI